MTGKGRSGTFKRTFRPPQGALDYDDPLNRHLFFWKDRLQYCPHCKQTFEYQDMWKGLARDRKNIWEIVDILKCSFMFARKHIAKFHLDFVIPGTLHYGSWMELARRANFNTVEEFLYYLKIKNHMSDIRIAHMISKPVDEVKQVFEYLFDPRFKENKKQRRERLEKEGGFKNEDINGLERMEKNEKISKTITQTLRRKKELKDGNKKDSKRQKGSPSKAD